MVQRAKKQRKTEALENVKKRQKRLKRHAVYGQTFRGAVSLLVVVAAISVLVVTLWMPVLQIYGSSMAPTLEAGQIVVSVKKHQWKTGEIVAFWHGNKLLISFHTGKTVKYDTVGK